MRNILIIASLILFLAYSFRLLYFSKERLTISENKESMTDFEAKQKGYQYRSKDFYYLTVVETVKKRKYLWVETISKDTLQQEIMMKDKSQ